MDWGNLFTAIAAAVVAFIAGLFTRRSAKESNASQLYSALTVNQTAELVRISARLEAVEADRDESKKLAREHVRWDWALVKRLRAVLPDEEFPDPPPLDT